MRLLDCTPTWAGIYRVYVEVSRNGTSQKARLAAREELVRMTGMSAAEVMELVEAALNGVSIEVRREADARFESYAVKLDEENERAKAQREEEERNPADDEPDHGETYLPRDEGAPPRGI